MSFSGFITAQAATTGIALGNVEDKNPVYRENLGINSIRVNAFDMGIVPLLDAVILNNDLYYMSTEQQKFILQYFAEADTGLPTLALREFDEFLGSI